LDLSTNVEKEGIGRLPANQYDREDGDISKVHGHCCGQMVGVGADFVGAKAEDGFENGTDCGLDDFLDLL